MPILLERYTDIQRRKREKLEKDLNLCNEQIEKNIGNATLWEKKAKLLKFLGRSEEADEAYEEAALIEPNNYKIRIEQGDASEQAGKYESAVTAYEKALELKEDYNIWWKKGKALTESEKYDEAIASYNKTVVLEPAYPDNYTIRRELGSLLQKVEQLAESVELYKKSLELQPRYRVSSYEKRKIYKELYFKKN